MIAICPANNVTLYIKYLRIQFQSTLYVLFSNEQKITPNMIKEKYKMFIQNVFALR